MTEHHPRHKLIAGLATLAVLAIVVLWMMLSVLTVDTAIKEWPPRHHADILADNSEFVELLDMPTPKPTIDRSAKAYDPIDENNISTPSEISGTETVDEGPKGEPSPVVTSERPSPVKVEKKPKPEKPGPAEDAEAKQQDRIRRQARSATAGAFNGKGKNNTTNPTGARPGDSGSPAGTASAINGRFNGRAGGGWSLPGYGVITSPCTGTVKVKVTIDRSGAVTEAIITGGTPPAATDPTTKANILKEIKSKRFHRSDNNPPDQSTAYMTISF